MPRLQRLKKKRGPIPTHPISAYSCISPGTFLKQLLAIPFFFLISRKINLDLLRTLTVNVIVCDTHEGEKEKVRKDVLLELLLKT